jgi:integrase
VCFLAYVLWKTLGEYPSMALARAKEEAQTQAVAVRLGRDPILERRTAEAAETFKSLAERYLAEHERKNARAGRRSQSTNEAQRYLAADILPMVGDHRGEAVTKRHVMQVVEAVADRGAYVAADRVFGLIGAIYNWAAATGRLEANPTLGLKKRNAARARERVLSSDEIRTFWLALDEQPKLSHEIRDALRLELLLGVRIREALQAPKSEIDLTAKVWVLPAIRTKSGRELRLPLSPWVADILEAAMERAGKSPWMFPSPVDGEPIRPSSASRAVIRLRGRIGLVDVGTHDLRRTLATGLGNLGVPDEVIERVLNHAPRTVTGKHYNHARHFEAKRRALETWAEHVRAIVEGRERASNMLPLRSAAG